MGTEHFRPASHDEGCICMWCRAANLKDLDERLPNVNVPVITYKDHPFVFVSTLLEAGYHHNQQVGDIVRIQGVYFELAGQFNRPGSPRSWFLVPLLWRDLQDGDFEELIA